MKIDIQDPSKLISDGDQISSISSQLKREIDKIYHCYCADGTGVECL